MPKKLPKEKKSKAKEDKKKATDGTKKVKAKAQRSTGQEKAKKLPPAQPSSDSDVSIDIDTHRYILF